MTTITTDQTLVLNLASVYSTDTPFSIQSLTVTGLSVDIGEQTMYMNINTGLQDQTLVINGFGVAADQTLVIGQLTASRDQTLFLFIVEKISGDSIVTNALKLPFNIGPDSSITHTGTHLLLANTLSDTNLYLLENKNLFPLITTPLSIPVVGIAYVKPHVYVLEKGTVLLKRINLHTGLVQQVINDDSTVNSGVYDLTGVTAFNTNSGLTYDVNKNKFFVIDGDSRLFEYDPNVDMLEFKQQLTDSDYGGLEYDFNDFLLRTNNRLSSIFKLKDGGVALSILGPKQAPAFSISDIAYSGNRAYTIHVNHPFVYEIDITSVPDHINLNTHQQQPQVLNNNSVDITATVLDITENVLTGYKTDCLTLQKVDLLSLLLLSPQSFVGDVSWVVESPREILDQVSTTTSDKFITLFDEDPTSGILLQAGESVSISLSQQTTLQTIQASLELYSVEDPESIVENKLIVETTFDGVNYQFLAEMILNRDVISLTTDIDEFVDRNISFFVVNNLRIRAHSDNQETILLKKIQVLTHAESNAIDEQLLVSDSLGQITRNWSVPVPTSKSNMIFNSTFNKAFKGWSYSGDGQLRMLKTSDSWSAHLLTQAGEQMQMTSDWIHLQKQVDYVFSAYGASINSGQAQIKIAFYDIDKQLIDYSDTLSFQIVESRNWIQFTTLDNVYWCKVFVQISEQEELIIRKLQLECLSLTEWNERAELIELIKSVAEY